MHRRHALALGLALLASLASPLTEGACSASTSGFKFGAYGPLDPRHRDSRGDIVVECTGAPRSVVSYALRLSTGVSGSFRPRAMVRGSGRLDYNIFTGASRSAVWGDGTAGTEVIIARLRIPASGSPARRTHRMFGRLFARQRAAPGAYSDVIQITLETCTGAGECELAQATLTIQ